MTETPQGVETRCLVPQATGRRKPLSIGQSPSGAERQRPSGPSYGTSMGKHIAKVKFTLTKRTVDALMPEDKPWIAWNDKVTGFGGRVYRSGQKSFAGNYRSGNGGRNAPNKWWWAAPAVSRRTRKGA